MSDPRLAPVDWAAAPPSRARRVAIRGLLIAGIVLAAWYFGWLLQPARIGHPVLFALLAVAELFNLVQALGFWSTVARDRAPRRAPVLDPVCHVDVFIPVYDEPVPVVEPTVAAALRIRGPRVHVHVLDDGDSPQMAAMAGRLGAGYLRRSEHDGAKAGNVNHALGRTDAPYVVVLDSDHVPDERFLEATLGHLQADPKVAFVQTPQYYANHDSNDVAAAAWAQQALFFGPIARGKDGWGAMFCAGTNVVFRRSALEAVGGLPTGSLTEDFELSVHLHERGWRTVYVPEVLARGVGPEDMASYVSQQQRWARGCLAGLATALKADLPLRLKFQYGLSSMYFLSGWTVLVYASFPVVRILTGAQPLAGTTADQFLLHFAPYFLTALLTVAVAGGGVYTFRAFALAAASSWIHVQATVRALLRRRGRFVVTPKEGVTGPQPRTVLAPVAMVTVLLAAAVYGLARDREPSTVNNAAFALFHVSILLSGAWPALRRRGPAAREPEETPRLQPSRA